MAKVLIVDDDESMGIMLATLIRNLDHEARYALTLKEGVKEIQSESYDVVFLDVRMPDGNGLEVLSDIRKVPEPPEVIIITGAGDPDGAEMAIKNGAWDYMQKPISPKKAALPLKRVLEYRDNLKAVKRPPIVLKRSDIIGKSDSLNACLEQVGFAAGCEANVLITGETGTGKELFAKAIHQNSGRAGGNLIVVDCAALPGTLVESTLFGHEKGAFTGAQSARDGLIKLADQGTLFLDEIGELELNLQKSFLRVLQERRYRPVGSKDEIKSDFRLIAATNRDLDQMVNAGQFRKDLLYRLRAISIQLPSLKGRVRDIQEIALHYANSYYEKLGIPQKGFSPDFIDALNTYHWPGNVRELINALEGAISQAMDEPILFSKHIPADIRVQIAKSSLHTDDKPTEASQQEDRIAGHLDMFSEFPQFKVYRNTIIENAESRYFEKLMEKTGGDIRESCRISALGRTRLYNLLKKYNLSRAK